MQSCALPVHCLCPRDPLERNRCGKPVSGTSPRARFAARMCVAILSGWMFVSGSLHAGEPVLQLAMLRPGFEPLLSGERQNVPTPAAPGLSGSLTAFGQATFTSVPNAPGVDSIRFNYEFSGSLIQKAPAVGRGNPLSFFGRRKAANDSGFHSLQIGYGQICYDKPEPVWDRTGAGWTEPSCGYFKLCFTF